MRFSTSLLLSLSTLLVATSAQTQAHVESVNCLAFPNNTLPDGGRKFLPEAVTGLSQAFANNSFPTPLPADGIKLSPGQARSFGWGTNEPWGVNATNGYQICVQNWYVFKSFTIPLDALSTVVSRISTDCCNPNAMKPPPYGRLGQCQDAKVVYTMADGSAIDIIGQDYGDNCCGFFGCQRGK